MRKKLAFVHTSAAHIDTFQRLVIDLADDVKVTHFVAADLLADAMRQGAIDDVLAERIRQQMRTAKESGASVVVCTCSTLGGIAEGTDLGRPGAAQRIDRQMADEAVQKGSQLLMVTAASSTREPTRRLLESSAARFGVSITIHELHLPSAWELFQSDRLADYMTAIELGIRNDTRNFDVIVLAQASMAAVETRLVDLGIPVFSSPKLGVAAAIRQLQE